MAEVGPSESISLHERFARAAELESEGEWAAADQLYASLFVEAARARDVVVLVDGLRRQGDVRHRHGSNEEATELVWLSHEIAELHGLQTAAARSLNVLATIQYFSGRLADAERLFQEALERARALRDDELISMTCQNLGVLANIEGRLRDARTLYLESIAAAVRTHSVLAAAHAYQSLGMVCTDTAEYMEAGLYFERGIELARPLGNLHLLAHLYLNASEPLIHIGELQRAEESLRLAELHATQTSDRDILAALPRFRAMLARRMGQMERAELHLADGLRLSSEAGLELERAEVLEEQARLRWAQRRAGAARALLREAGRLYGELGARTDLARVEEQTAEWIAHTLQSARAGD
ncbi:MAG TPA: hypothetical protein VFI96_02310 [Longimicrobiaceae bacterium]|nr:hypothetical protein [Longimicrobiaceae bacterium]